MESNAYGFSKHTAYFDGPKFAEYVLANGIRTDLTEDKLKTDKWESTGGCKGEYTTCIYKCICFGNRYFCS